MRKYIRQVLSFAMLALIVLLCSSVVYAATWQFAFPTTVVDTSSTTRTYYPVILGYGGQQLIDAGYIDASGLDTNMQIGTTSIKYMISTDNVTAVIPSLPSGGSVNTYLYTGYSPNQTNFSIIVGDGGYITIADNSTLELGDNFTIELKGYINTDNGTDKNLVFKEGAFRVFISGSNEITAVRYGNGSNTADYDPSADGSLSENTLSGETSRWRAMQDDLDTSYLRGTNENKTDLFTNSTIRSDRGIYDTINSVEVFWRAKEVGNNCKGNANVYVNGSLYSTGQVDYIGAWVWRSNEWAINPDNSEEWEVSDLEGLEFGFTQQIIDGSAPDTSETYVRIDYAPSAYVVATGITSGERIITVSGDGSDLALSVTNYSAVHLGNSPQTASLGANVTDNATTWFLDQNEVMPYIEYYKHSVNATLVAHYEPDTILAGAVLADEQGGDENGTIHWGSNTDLSVVYGTMLGYESAEVTSAEIEEFEMPTAGLPETWFATGENIENLPFYDVFNPIAVELGMPVQTMYFWGIIGIAFGVALFLIMFTRSVLLGVIALTIVLFVGSSMTIIPMWVPFCVLIVDVLIMFLYRQVSY